MRYVLSLLLVFGIADTGSAQQDATLKSQQDARILQRHGATPDTTSPWRYYPLHVGNTWEYERDDGLVTRRIIEKDTVIANVDYVVWKDDYIIDGDIIDFERLPLRYDTLTATVMFRAKNGQELPFFLAACRLDSDFGVMIVCSPGIDFLVTGTTSGTIEFEPETTVEGVTIKTFQSEFYNQSFSAGFGETERVVSDGGGVTRITYARIDGIVYGTAQYPVAIEPNGPREVPLQGLTLWPNPLTDTVFIILADLQFVPHVIRIFDMRGRRLREVHSGNRLGSAVISLNVSDFPRGTYSVVATDSQAGLSQATLITKH